MIYNLGEKKPSFNKDNVWIAKSADLIGEIILEDDVSVWFNVTIRGDNDKIHIRKGTNIQDNTVIHTDEGIPVNIGENSTVGHKVIIHGASVGKNTVIGMGSVLMNHAVVGNNSIIGANSLITERKEFPDNSLIMGSPAKLIRALSDEEIEVLKLSSKHYIEKSKRYSQELTNET
ncbi:gamma carbonic anhydrase family protein [SAR86 cluster bacterium]|jgi:carbonic anhydrase/acetyltransferase-like protein (isoleucine patch superfamily)|nr:gamma carbonic anhydrase family protein [SAR86 cluster bacterium]